MKHDNEGQLGKSRGTPTTECEGVMPEQNTEGKARVSRKVAGWLGSPNRVHRCRKGIGVFLVLFFGAANILVFCLFEF